MTVLWWWIGLGMAAGVQARLPTLWWLGGLRLELMPAVVAFGALTLRRWPALGFALAAGLLTDALSAGPFGLSALAFGIATVLISAAGTVLERELPWFQMVAGAAVAAAANLAGWLASGPSAAGLGKVAAVAALTALVTPLVFVAGDWIRHQGRAV